MNVLHPICCGIDVHQAILVCALRIVLPDGTAHKQLREFGTTTAQLLLLCDWLTQNDCPVVAMESTGVYWKPVYHILSPLFEVIVGNPRDMKLKKGNKTDEVDASWISELLAHGLIQASFVPPPPIRGLRDLTRMRIGLVETRTTVKNRVMKVLEDANIKLSSVASNVFGKSGRAMLEAMVRGERKPEVLAEFALGRLRKKKAQLKEALDGMVTEHHAMMLKLYLEQSDQLEEHIAQIEEKLSEQMASLQEPQRQLATIPGVSETAAQVILSEIGTNMDQFGSAQRLSSWAGVCPGNKISAGKRKGSRSRKGNKYLRRILVQCAWAASKTDTFLGRTFHRLASRMGKKRAAVAVGHKILVLVYHLLVKGEEYEESRYEDQKEKREAQHLRRALNQLNQLGYQVEINTEEKTLNVRQKEALLG